MYIVDGIPKFTFMLTLNYTSVTIRSIRIIPVVTCFLNTDIDVLRYLAYNEITVLSRIFIYKFFNIILIFKWRQ